LCDPLIARLPAFDPEHWRIGHVLRRIPEGYWETLAWGENRMHHAGLRRYVDALLTIVRAPVFAAEAMERDREHAFWRVSTRISRPSSPRNTASRRACRVPAGRRSLRDSSRHLLVRRAAAAARLRRWWSRSSSGRA
jgi:hypothetical protein